MDKNQKMKNLERTIPVFYAADDNYLPFLAVALTSLKHSASKDNFYKIHVLYTGTLGEDKQKILDMQTENFSVEFNDLSDKIEKVTHLMHCRDYYTSAIYYRLFIPDMFPQYDKAIYLDCDTVLLSDIAKLYDVEIGENLIGAVADQVVASVPAFRDYTKNALGILPEKYFNSGVITLNLEKLRDIHFYHTFSKILGSYHFIVAPDQDCLNLICKGKVYYYGKNWNVMPVAGKRVKPDLVHYNLSLKPWHYEGVEYEDVFWQFAAQTPFFAQIAAQRAAFTPEQKKRDDEAGVNLIALAQAEADSPYNYLHTVVEKEEGNAYGFIENITRETVAVKADRRI